MKQQKTDHLLSFRRHDNGSGLDWRRRENFLKEVTTMKTGLLGLVVGLTACAHQQKVASDPVIERMAQMHSKMATCLRENRSFDDCHAQMMTACQKQGPDGCPMMGMHKGRGRMGMMDKAPPAKKLGPAKGDEHSEHHPDGAPETP